jgi:hypothetical protein
VVGWLTILISAASGAVVTLVGVVAGGVIASRSQRQQWARDKQLGACAEVVQESTRMQLALRQRWRGGASADWTAWNQALAMTWLVGTAAVRAGARRMDRLFWLCSAQIKSGQILDETAWATVGDEMGVARRDFINASRREVARTRESVDDVPVARPSLAEIRQFFGSASVHDDYAASEPSEPVDEV